MRVGSLFSGIGGFDLGLERAGFTVAWQCEADEFCRRVLAKHWPSVPCHPDVRTLRADTVEPVDVLCGGFPCQDLSVAGRGAGIDGARSGLWAEYARLVDELRPRYVIVENVSALLARGLGRVLGDLAACGYDAEWDCIRASDIGAPHQRDRFWLVAYPERESVREQSGGGCGEDGQGEALARLNGEAQPLADSEGLGSELRAPEGERPRGPSGCGTANPRSLPDADSAGREKQRRSVTDEAELAPTQEPSAQADAITGEGDPRRVFGSRGQLAAYARWVRAAQWAAEPDVGRVANGVPARVDRLRSLGNALLPQIAQWLGERILEYERGPVSAA